MSVKIDIELTDYPRHVSYTVPNEDYGSISDNVLMVYTNADKSVVKYIPLHRIREITLTRVAEVEDA